MNSASDESGARLIAIFDEAKLHPPGQPREQFLAQACADDANLRASVDELLRAHDAAGSFLKPAVAVSTELEAEFARLKPEEAGDRIGPYKLLEQIGEGGFGTVWVAEQAKPVRRRVALKIIKLGMDTKEVIARFEQERQAVAMMDHANIAKVFDAGATETGRPYFVMELVHGIKITEYCDQANLSTTQRLELFIAVCHAVQHAHQKGIIHRDLKPSNILVTLHDGVPVPKVIDFGVAKATQQQRLTELTVYTQFQQMIGTPLYMSPEQAEMSGLDIDTRSDIYSLGVLLYELLTGRTPFEAEELMRVGVDEMRRVIREQEPKKPSTALSTMIAARRSTVAQHRDCDAAKLISTVQGDLDWIAMKCLEKDRTRRYETANGLAADLQRHLDNQPVLARPPSRTYQFSKFVRRNKLAVAAISAVAAALVIGLGAATWMFFKERHARERAQTAEAAQTQLRQQAEANERKAAKEATKSAQVAALLKDMLEGVQPAVAMGRDTSLLRDILDRTGERLDKELKDQPEVEAELRFVLGNTYLRLSEYARAEKMHREALRLRLGAHGEVHPAVADSMDGLTTALLGTKGAAAFKEAEEVGRRALTVRQQLAGNDPVAVAASLRLLARAVAANSSLSEAIRLGRHSLELLRKANADPLEMAYSLTGLARNLGRQGNLVEAEALLREALDIRKKHLRSDNQDIAYTLGEIGVLLRKAEPARAETAFREALEVHQRILSPTHPDTVQATTRLIDALRAQQKDAEAEKLSSELAAARKANAAQEVRAAQSTAAVEAALDKKPAQDKDAAYARGLVEQGARLREAAKPQEAEPLFREALAIRRKLHPTGHKDLASSLANLALALRDLKRFDEAEQSIREAMEMQRRLLGENSSEEAFSWQYFASILQRKNQFGEAEAAYRSALELKRKNGTWNDPSTITVLSSFSGMLASQQRAADALPLMRDELDLRKKLHGEDTPKVLEFADHVARQLSVHGEFSEAETLWRGEVERLRAKEKKAGTVTNPAIGLLLHHWAQGLTGAKRAPEARALAEEAWRLYEQNPYWPEGERHHAFQVLLGTMLEMGDRAGLVSLQPQILEQVRATRSAEDSFATGALAELVLHQLKACDYEQAESNGRELLKVREKFWPEDWRTFNTRSMLGDSLLSQKKHGEAEPFLLSGYEGMEHRKGSIPPLGKVRIREGLERLVRYYEATGANEKAAEWKGKLAAFEKEESAQTQSGESAKLGK